jgi:hypothetical protein
MKIETATIVASLIGVFGVIIAAIVTKYDIYQMFKIRKFNLTGTWYGMSIYLPVY